jgi:biotin carboxyl carrier protein
MSRSASEAPVETPSGEILSVPERLVIAPTAGVFRCCGGMTAMSGGDVVKRGDVVGALHSLGAATPVQSPFDGVLMAFLAVDGERVRQGQPLAWLRVVRG